MKFKPSAPMAEATILHIDADAFFASVEQRLEPKLRGKPVIVGGEHRGVVSSASYEARKFGIHSAMPIYKAGQLCPHGIFIKGRYEVYGEFSRRMFEIAGRYTPAVEVTSVDEGYLDLAGTSAMHKAGYPEIAGRLLREVESQLGITLSGGLSTGKMVSKIASSHFKPRRLTWVWPGKETNFLAPFSIRAIPGIGPKTAPRLEHMGFLRIGDLAALNFEGAWKALGGYGIYLWECARGVDRRMVQAEHAGRKSVSSDRTFPVDINDQGILWKEAEERLKELCFQLRQENVYAKTLTLKIRYADFQTTTHQASLEKASNRHNDFLDALRQLLKKRDHKRKVRLIGVGLSHVAREVQLSLLNKDGGASAQRLQLETKLDSIRQKYGRGIV